MGVTTVGVVITKEKNPFTIFNQVSYSLFESAKEKTGIDNFRCYYDTGYSSPKSSLSTTSKLMSVSFEFNKEKRDMSIHFDCDRDYADETKQGKRIIVSLGCWGSSVEIVEIILNGLKRFGKVYIDENDCDSVSFREV